MRNIVFDESLVLREFARIAGEKGLIKQAENMITLGPAEVGKGTVWSPSMSASAYSDYMLRKMGVDMSQPPNIQSKQLLPELVKKFNEHLEKEILPTLKLLETPADKAEARKYYVGALDGLEKKLTEWYGTMQSGTPLLPLATVETYFTFPAINSMDKAISKGATAYMSNVKRAKQTFLQKAIMAVKNPVLKKELEGLNVDITPDKLQEYLKLRGFSKVPDELAPLMAKGKTFLQQALDVVKNPVLKKELETLKSDITPQQLQEFLTLRGFGKVPDELASLLSSSSTKHMLSKRAKGDSVYDVTGETGEELIEKAHPGGGTKTELTHSKTDENLVETVVEQQERDVEVAKKKPTGVYAILQRLHDDLEKMGHKEKLGPLVEAIEKSRK